MKGSLYSRDHIKDGTKERGMNPGDFIGHVVEYCKAKEFRVFKRFVDNKPNVNKKEKETRQILYGYHVDEYT